MHTDLPVTPDGLPVLRGAKRARRLDVSLTAMCSIGVVRGKKARTAVQCILSCDASIAESTARSTELTTMSNYLWQSNECFDGVVQASICLDASRLGDEETLQLAFFSRQRSRVAWLPPQAQACNH